jgi:lipopolysaccharide O-acetyltransferase
MNLDSNYSVPDWLRLAWSFLITKIFFNHARIIRQPSRVRGYKHMQLGENFTTGSYCRIEAGSKSQKGSYNALTIGNNVQLNDRCHIAALFSITIEDNVLIASGVYISDHDHGDTSLASLKTIPKARELKYAPVIIEQCVWIGQNATILKGVRVGRNSIVAAGAIVTKDVPAYSVVAGVPARVIKQYERV